jgi:hypothetical protein
MTSSLTAYIETSVEVLATWGSIKSPHCLIFQQDQSEGKEIWTYDGCSIGE